MSGGGGTGGGQRLVFFGTEDYSAGCLTALLAAGYEVALAVTKPDAPAGRGRAVAAPAVKRAAEEHGVPVWQPTSLRVVGAAERLAAAGAEAGVLVAYGKLVPPAVLEVFARGIINVHPSLLPRYRGPAPIEASILHDDDEAGVTLMRLDAGMDTGPMYAQERVGLTGGEERTELYNLLFGLGTQLLIEELPRILDGTLQPTPQPHEGMLVTRLIQKSDGMIDWHKPAAQLEREVRAYRGWPGSRTELFGQDVIVTEARAVSTPDDGELTRATGDQGWLAIERLKPAGKREMTAKEFLAGVRQ